MQSHIEAASRQENQSNADKARIRQLERQSEADQERISQLVAQVAEKEAEIKQRQEAGSRWYRAWSDSLDANASLREEHEEQRKKTKEKLDDAKEQLSGVVNAL